MCHPCQLDHQFVVLGPQGDEIGTDQRLPLTDPKADVAYEEIVLRRSNRIECLLYDRETDIAHVPSE